MGPVQTRYKPITIVAVLLGILGVAGYLTPASTEGAPNRLLFENAGGKVVFTHKVHTSGYKVPCQQCHHESDKPSKNPAPCITCHPSSYEEGFVEQHQKTIGKEYCSRCHHAELGKNSFDHKAHKDSYSSGCTDCHHDKSIEAEPTSCSDCHQAQGDESMPSLRKAVHTRCASCHQDMYDLKIKGCIKCHSLAKGGAKYPSCFSCHYDAKKLPLPSKMEAYHSGCMGCHKDKGAGPHTQQDCNKCHFR